MNKYINKKSNFYPLRIEIAFCMCKFILNTLINDNLLLTQYEYTKTHHSKNAFEYWMTPET